MTIITQSEPKVGIQCVDIKSTFLFHMRSDLSEKLFNLICDQEPFPTVLHVKCVSKCVNDIKIATQYIPIFWPTL